jgi:uncharacterized repeat protein (TIGR01451 family)
MRIHRLIFPILAGLALAIALLFAAVRQSRAALDASSQPVSAAPQAVTHALHAGNPQATTRYVATAGTDSGDCVDSANPCRTVQYAVDQALEGDEVRVAAGEYTDVHFRPRQDITTTGYVTQVVYISKTVAVQGGYTLTNWITADPDANPTILDAQGEGRVVYITGLISPTLEGFQITGGDSTCLGGIQLPYHLEEDAGGGIYIHGASAHISNLKVIDNISPGYGGGIHLSYNNAIIQDSTLAQNNALMEGGGLSTYEGANTIIRNTISNNQALDGGGFSQIYGTSIITGNQFISNTANSSGGGLYIFYAESTTTGNHITRNTASNSGGGGLLLYNSEVALRNNYIRNNSSITSHAGGIYTFDGNLILERNNISENYAWATGGMRMEGTNTIIDNNIIVDNDSLSNSAGIMIWYGEHSIRHNTIARNNGGVGIGVLLAAGTVTLTNNIIVSHTVGVYCMGDAILEGTLWGSGIWANEQDWAGEGIITGTVNLWGDPGFLDPDNGNYHIGHGSAAIDAGVDAGVYTDIDGEPRPIGLGFDIGADELQAALRLGMGAAPDLVASGDVLTYTLHLTNTGAVELHATITQTLPNGVTPGGILTWTASLPVLGSEWTETVVVTVDPDYSGPLTSTLYVGSLEGAQGIVTSSVTAIQPVAGLSAVNNSPTTLSQPTAFTATVAAGGYVNFTWDFGDGSTGSGALAEHTYLLVGTYTVTVTASNTVSAQTTETTVLVEEAISGLSSANSSPTILGQPTAFTATITAGSNVIFTWDFGDSSTGNSARIEHTYPSLGVYTATLTATNLVSQVMVPTVITIYTPGHKIYLPLNFRQVSFNASPLKFQQSITPNKSGPLHIE